MDVLRQFAEDPLPPSGVDIARAVRRGQRRRRLQRSATAALGVVAVAVAAIAVVPRLAGQPSIADSPAAPPFTCAAAAPLAPLSDTDFDLLRHWVDASAVPGYQVEGYATAARWQRVELRTADGTSRVDITVYGPHGQPVFAMEPSAAPVPIDPTTGTATEPVNGAAAYWLPGRQAEAQFEVARLGWQWAPDAWAFVGAADTSDDSVAHTDRPKNDAEIAQLRSVARQVAMTLHIGSDTPVTAPFTMPVPECTRLVGSHLLTSSAGDGTPFTRLTLAFAPEEYEQPTNPLLSRGEVPVLHVVADSYATPADKPGSATSQIDGHPAYVSDGFMVVHGVSGFAIELSAPGPVESLVSLFRSVTIVPGATHDPATWTDTPLHP